MFLHTKIYVIMLKISFLFRDYENDYLKMLSFPVLTWYWAHCFFYSGSNSLPYLTDQAWNWQLAFWIVPHPESKRKKKCWISLCLFFSKIVKASVWDYFRLLSNICRWIKWLFRKKELWAAVIRDPKTLPFYCRASFTESPKILFRTASIS